MSTPAPATPNYSEQEEEFTDEGFDTPVCFHLGDPQKSTAAALDKYVEQAIVSYKDGEDRGWDLWNAFREDFFNWEPQSLHRVGTQPARRLRDVFLKYGVYIPKDGSPIASHLERLLRQPYIPWPENVPKSKQLQQEESSDEAPTPVPAKNEGTAAGKTREKYQAPEQDDLDDLDSKLNNLGVRNTKNVQARDLSRDLASLAKLCPSDFRYSGRNDVFSYKYKVFLSNANTCGVPPDCIGRAIQLMLSDEALDFYYANVEQFSTKNPDEIREMFCGYFEGREHKTNLLSRWNTVTLETVIDKNKEETLSKCLEILMGELRKLQSGLDAGLQGNDFVYSKLITACERVPACKFACIKPSDSLRGLINELYGAAGRWDRLHPKDGSSNGSSNEILFTDRRLRGENRYERVKYQPNQPRGHERRYQGRNQGGGDTRNQKRCFVCKKIGCWSTKHPEDERKRALRQYVVDHEGEEENELEDREEEDLANRQDDDQDDEENEAYFTSINGQLTYEKLTNQATFHAITGSTIAPERISLSDTAGTVPISSESLVSQMRYSKEQFYGIMIDTGASFSSSAGHNQYLALSREQNVSIDKSSEGTATFKFGIGTAVSIGTITVKSPIGDLSFHVVDADTPFLLSLKDLDATGYYFDNQSNHLVKDKQRVPVSRIYGHPFLTWETSLSNFCSGVYMNGEGQLTEQELRRLHRRFGHPSTSRLSRILRRSRHDFDKETLGSLTKYCTYCQKHGRSPHRFKFSIKDDLQFNRSILADIMYLEQPSVPVLHIVDEATRFQAARFLKDISASHVWDVLRACWVDTYLGPPDMIVHDAGRQFTSTEFSTRAAGMGIKTKMVPVEAHHSIGMVERYHAPLKRCYEIIREELPEVSKPLALQMAVKAVNDTAGPDGLTPTLLLFGSFPRMSEDDLPHPSIAERSKAIKKAMKEVSSLHAKRQVTEAIRLRNGPDVATVLDTAIGSNVLVFRERKGWKGPYQLLAVDPESQECMVKLNRGPTKFRTTVVKPYLESTDDSPELVEDRDVTGNSPEEEEEEGSDPEEPEGLQEPVEPVERRNPQRKQRLPARFVNITAKEQSNLELATRLRAEGMIRSANGPFIDSRKKEIDDLILEGVFKVIGKEEITPGTRIFGCRFVDEIKYRMGAPYEKSRLVVQAYRDGEKKNILTQSPTIQRVSQRLILCLAASLPRSLCVRDISQAYVQSKTSLNRPFYVKPPAGTDLGDNLLKVMRPLYGVPEAGTHWFKTYHDHHLQRLGLRVSTFDPCLMYSSDAVVGLQTDDSLFCATDNYIKLEEQERQEAGFPAKDIEVLGSGKDLQFNGATITKDGDNLHLYQERQCAKISLIDVKAEIKSQYIKERARGAYVSSMCQPEAAYPLSKAAQTTEPGKEEAVYLNKCLGWQRENGKRGLRFLRLNPEELKLFIFVDASFANNKDLSSQIGYVILIAEEQRKNDEEIMVKGNIVHWSSTKCKRVTRSVLASELYAMVAGFDIGASIQSTLTGITEGKKIPLILCTDSYSLYDCMIKLGTTAEKRLMIDIMGLRESYEKREIDEIRWIDGASNPADAMTKDKPCVALSRLISTNQLAVKTSAWVDRG